MTSGSEPLEILVCAKQVRRLEADTISFTGDGLDVDPDLVDTALNEWDAFATEAALRLREEHGGRVTVVTHGPAEAERALRRCLAMGADRAIRLDGAEQDPLTTARALAWLAESEQPDLILCGVQSSDAGHSATGTMLAQLLGVPCVALVKTATRAGAAAALVERELEGGLVEQLEVALPAVLTVQTGTNQPRYVNLRALKQADNAEIETRVTPERVAPGAYRVRRMFVPEAERAAEMLDGDASAIASRIAAIVQERLA